jgi:hypothetical protein
MKRGRYHGVQNVQKRRIGIRRRDSSIPEGKPAGGGEPRRVVLKIAGETDVGSFNGAHFHRVRGVEQPGDDPDIEKEKGSCRGGAREPFDLA